MFLFWPIMLYFMLEILTQYAFLCTLYAIFHNDYAFLPTIILNVTDYNAVKKSRKIIMIDYCITT